LFYRTRYNYDAAHEGCYINLIDEEHEVSY